MYNYGSTNVSTWNKSPISQKTALREPHLNIRPLVQTDVARPSLLSGREQDNQNGEQSQEVNHGQRQHEGQERN